MGEAQDNLFDPEFNRSINAMADQLHLWGDRDEQPLAEAEPIVEYQTPAEPPSEPPPDPTSLERDLQLL